MSSFFNGANLITLSLTLAFDGDGDTMFGHDGAPARRWNATGGGGILCLGFLVVWRREGDDDVLCPDWCRCMCKDSCHVECFNYDRFKSWGFHMATSECI